ncbi:MULTISPECIES: alpha/beta hydrolase [unclassified Streptomyces]|uniref:alpha/beta hydrolase n=1 Tax=unclassified Streptomyces TaxID=2593676 RepID=UPI001487C11B|nr:MULTISPECIES: alpha/beta hydrolase [unclassified Streptomyces]
MDYATLKALKPTEFSDAADGFRRTGDMASAAQDRIEKQITAAMRKSLEGEAANAALGQLRELAENFHYTRVECGLISTALDGFAYDLEAAKKKLDAAVEGAQAERFTVNSDGSINYPPGGEKVDGELPKGGTVTGLTDATASALGRQAANFDPNPHHGRAQQYADQIATALKEATEADEKWAPKLRALKADDDLTVSDRDWADVKKDAGGVLKVAGDYLDSIKEPPKDGSPKENAEWWDSLTAEEQAAYVALHPAAVGALDGLPSDIRDEANRAVLAETQATYQLELASIPQEPNKFAPNPNGSYPAVVQTQAWQDWNEKYGERHAFLTNSLKGMNAIQSRFDATGKDGLPPAYLLGFDTKGNGHAMVANGNPDTADHTAVYVPGTKSRLEGAGGDIGRMQEVWDASDQLAPGESVSTITWIGYDAPQSVAPEAMDKHWAHEGAPKLNQFLDGLQTVQGGADASHTTVIGHSYGSTTVGAASQQGDLAADDIVVAGSPGMLAPDADDLDVGRDHVWSEAARDDLVPVGGKVAGLGGLKWDVETWNGVPYNVGYVQVVPSDEAFGAHRMDVDTSGHSGYWDHGSQSLWNQAAVVTGRYNQVKEDD